ncbi:MAG: biotin/lipoyl-containing protein [Rhodothermales bacterium]
MQGVRYHVQLGESTYEIVLGEGAATIDGRPVDLSIEVTPGGYSLIVDGQSYRIQGEADEHGGVRFMANGVAFSATARDDRAMLLDQYGAGDGARHEETEVRAPMPGLVVKILVETGVAVRKGDGLVILEAMKMENELRAPQDGTIHRIHVAGGEAVQKSQILIELG